MSIFGGGGIPYNALRDLTRAGGYATTFNVPAQIPGDGAPTQILWDVINSGSDGLLPGDALTVEDGRLIIHRPCIVTVNLAGVYEGDVSGATELRCFLVPQNVVDLGNASEKNYWVLGDIHVPTAPVFSIAGVMPLTEQYLAVVESKPSVTFPYTVTAMTSQDSGAPVPFYSQLVVAQVA